MEDEDKVPSCLMFVVFMLPPILPRAIDPPKCKIVVEFGNFLVRS